MVLLLATILILYGILASFAIFSKSTTIAVITYSAISSAAFFVYYMYNAADVALTEISIGMFLTFFFFYIVHHKAGSALPENKGTIEACFILLCAIVIFAILLYLGHLLEDIAVQTEYSYYYNANTYKETHIPNTITAILASYRGFDTMGETLIIATSSLGIATILQHKTKR